MRVKGFDVTLRLSDGDWLRQDIRKLSDIPVAVWRFWRYARTKLGDRL